ncbi:MAG: AI-2E family transporter [Candidatus Saccharimonadales bacterium]
MTVKVDVDTKTFVRFLLVASVFVGVVFLAWKLWPALMIIAVSFFLALALNAPVSALSRRLPGQSRIVATALSYLVVLSVLGVFIYIALPPIIDQTGRFINSLPGYVEEISQNRGTVSEFVNRYNLNEQLNEVVQGAQEQSARFAQGVGSSVVTGVTSVLTGFITLLTVLVLTFLMLVEGPRWKERMWHVYTDQERLERHQRLIHNMYKVVTGFVNGQVIVATIAASAGMLALLLLTQFFTVPVSAVIPLTGVILITSLIPMIGATIGATIITVVLLFNDVGAALVFLIYFIIYQQIENNLIQPVVQSRTVALSALSVFLAVIIGITLLGLVGGIVAIPVAGCTRVLILDYMEHRKNKPEPKRGLLAKLTNNT